MISLAFDLSTSGFSGSMGFSLLWADLEHPCWNQVEITLN